MLDGPKAERVGGEVEERERGVTTVWATVAPDNLPSRAACEKVGFEMVRLEPDYFGRSVIGFTIMAFLMFLSGAMRRRTQLMFVAVSLAEVALLSRAASSA